MDIKRTILWVIFSLAVILLFDNQQRANGHQPMFFPTPQMVTTTVAAPGSMPAGDVPSNASTTAAAGSQAAPATGAASQAPASEKIVISTDLLRATIDTNGTIVIKLELLDQKDHNGNPMVLFDRSVERTYLARSGLIDGDFPNHATVFAASPGPRDLGTGNDVSIMLTADRDGAKLAKTYVFKRGSYVINSRFDVTNDGTAPINPTLYLELARDGGAAEQSRFYSTFTDPVVYTDGDKFHKTTFADIDKGKAQVPAPTNGGWVAMVQHYFASAWIPANNVKREYYVNRVNTNFYRIGIQKPLGTVASGVNVSTTTRLFAGPQ